MFTKRGPEPSGKPEIHYTDDLTLADLERYKPLPSRGSAGIKFMRNSHHRLARLIARGLRQNEAAEVAGYSRQTVAIYMRDPTFQQLVSEYEKTEPRAEMAEVDEYYSVVIDNRITAARRLNDKLHDEEEEFTVAQLVAIHGDSADRTGYPKRQVAVNVNVDFASRLDRAISRSREVKALPPLIEHDPVSASGVVSEGASPSRVEVLPPPTFRRRA